ncbi:MAG: GLPGLI family protein [Niabella sp.]
MKQIITIFIIFLSLQLQAQTFIKTGMIEYEVKTNVYRQNEDNEWFERFKDQVDQFDINYYTYYFSDNKSVYKFTRKPEKQRTFRFWGSGDDESVWYNDYTAGTQTKLSPLDGYILTKGSQRKIVWKLDPSDQREIAGFNCRKAQTILFDSVYVFAYYTDEIAISGGPMGLHGLPGMILGVTIPRMFTSWIATGVQLTTPDAKIISAPTKGKEKSNAEIKAAIEQLSKSWGSNSKKWLDVFMWRTLL